MFDILNLQNTLKDWGIFALWLFASFTGGYLFCLLGKYFWAVIFIAIVFGIYLFVTGGGFFGSFLPNIGSFLPNIGNFSNFSLPS